MVDRGHYVPVAERASIRPLDGQGVALVLDEDLARRDRVDGGPVGCRYVDAEVECVARVLDPRIVEERAHGMLAIERRDGPGVGSGHGRPPLLEVATPLSMRRAREK